MTRDELISHLESGRTEFRVEDFSGQDLAGLNLSGCDLRRGDFTGCDLSNANLSNCILVASEFSGAQLVGSEIEGANFEKATGLDIANFVGAMYGATPITSTPIVDSLGGFNRIITNVFMQIGCLTGSADFWVGLTEEQLRGLVHGQNEQDIAVTWMNVHLPDSIAIMQGL